MIPRILTALVLAPLSIFLTLSLPTSGFGMVFFAIVGLALHEWHKLSVNSNQHFWWAIAVLLIACISVLRMPSQLIWLTIIGMAGFCWMIWIIGLVRTGLGQPTHPLKSLIEGVFILFASWCAVVVLHNDPANGPLKVVIMLSVVWSADSFAYFAGRRFGKRKLAPSVSPGKTVEGVVGGLLGALVVSGLLAGFLLDLHSSELFYWLAASFIAAGFSVGGDLFESRLKRHAGVKDSGSILPGHGGILDRIDGLIAATPVFVLVWWVLNWL